MKFAPALLVLAALAVSAEAQASPKPSQASVAAPTEADWRTPDPQNVLVIDTSKGRIVVEMSPAAAPASVARIRELTKAGFYDGRAFFRVIDNFMDQTGDPQDNGEGGSTKPNLPAEFAFRRDASTPLVVVTKAAGVESGFLGALPVIGQTMDLGLLTADHKVNAWGTFCPGVGGMARAEAPDSGNSQFFLMRAGQTNLDQKYTPWGRAISGLDVIRAIKTGEPPTPPADTMVKVRLLADIPAAERPTVRVIDPAGPWFQAMAARVKAQKAADFSICDLDIPSQVK
ncbi:MAG: peptidylprolyl isomerase [Pseudomonadota bacterium]|nr:peptidylprolyl isomerase [Pseudomonadota bacterium]